MISLIQLLLLLILSVSPMFEQFPERPQTRPDFDAEKAAGIHYYDVQKLQRRLKLKEGQLEPLTQLVDAFNREMDEIVSQHAKTFQKLNQDFNKSVQAAMRARDPSKMEGFKARTREILPPIAQDVQTKEQDLTDELRDVLDKPQFDKWLKYQRRNRPSSKFN